MMMLILKEIRINQWIKNLLLFAPLIFSGKLFDLTLGMRLLPGVLAFSFIASGVYLINDIFDFKHDKEHPVKKERPLSSGELSLGFCILLAVCFLLIGACLSLYLNNYFALILLGYFILNLLYSQVLKHVIIVDVLIVACFYVIRVMAGATLVFVAASYWLIICTFMLATFIGFAKRRHELVLLEDSAKLHRKILKEYSENFLDQMIAVVTTSTLLSYMLYTISETTFEKFHTRNLIYTFPFVMYGIFRYLYLIHKKNKGGDPSSLILSDKGLLINIFLWIVSVVAIIYYV